jgi:hypothetical protein
MKTHELGLPWIVLVLVLSNAACTLPDVQTVNTMPLETQIALTVAVEFENSQPAATSAPAATEAPSNELTSSGYPTIELDGGSGYLFASNTISIDDRDVWWNAIEFVPDTKMSLINNIADLQDVDAINLGMLTYGSYEVHLGDVYAIEIDRDRDGSADAYAVIRVLKVENGNVTFEYRYPFDGGLIP